MPPMVGVPFLLLCRSASSRTSDFCRSGWPSLRRVSSRMMRGPIANESSSEVSAAAMARNVS